MDSNCNGNSLLNPSTQSTDMQNRSILESVNQNTISSPHSINTNESVALDQQTKISIPKCDKSVTNSYYSVPQIVITPSTNCLHSQGSSNTQNSAAEQCQSTSGTPVSSTTHSYNTASVDSHNSTDRQCQSALGTPVLSTSQETLTSNEENWQNNLLESETIKISQEKERNVSCFDKQNRSTCNSNSEYLAGDQLSQNRLSTNPSKGPNTVKKDTMNQPLTINSVSSACWYFHAKIGDLQIPLLFDTGSTVSIISKDTYDQITSNRPSLIPTETTLTAANGSVLELLGQGVFKLETEVKTYNWKFLVANIEGNMGIIGQDFIETQGRYLRWRDLTWRVKGGVIKLFKLHSTQVAKIVVTDKVKVPPSSETFLTAKTDYPLYDELNMVEPSSNNWKRGLLVAKSLINQEGSSEISVMNLTDKPIKLRPGDILGHACPIEDLHYQDSEASLKTELPEHLKPLLENVSTDLSTNEKQQFTSLLVEFQDIFMSPDGQLGRTNVASHSIDVGNAKPIKIPPRKCPLAQREIIDTELDKMLAQKVIEPSDSPWSAPICLVKKSDGTYRFAIDFRGLNSVTVKDAYPLPNIRQIFDTLSGSKWYNTIDLASGYWQLQMEPNSKKYTAFATPTRGLFQFLVMPFGLCNAGATFERAIENVLGSLRWEKCICYLDDVIIFGSDFQTTLDNLRAVFSRLRSANLKLKPSKCTFFQRQVAFLGHIATESGTRCDPEKIKAVLNWPRPSSSKEIKSFLGLVNFYRSYILNCAQIAYPLNHLTKKNVKFKWDQACEDSFNELKRCLTSAPLLAYPTATGKLILQTDASLFGIGGILSQEQDGKEVVIAYASKTLTKAQQNYCTTMRELYAVVYFVRYFKHYLMGRHFDIHTDHASLTWIKNFKDADGMLSRWLTVLDTYDFTILHKKGSQMQHVDALSRIPPRKCKHANCVDCSKKAPAMPVNPSSAGQGVHPYQQIKASKSTGEDATVCGALSAARAEGYSSPNASDSNEILVSNWLSSKTKEELRELQLADPEIAIVLLSKEKNEKPSKEAINTYSLDSKTIFYHWDVLDVREGVLYKRYEGINGQNHFALVTPASLRKEIFTELHTNHTAGHFGRDRTVDIIKRRFYWPNITDTVKKWCISCDLCARGKPGPGVGKYPLKQIKATRRFQVIALDIFGPLPRTEDGNEYIVVIGDYFTKYMEAFALPNHTALTVADVLVTQIICRYGCMEQLHSDMGPEFESRLFQEVCRLLGIKKTRTTPYRPQCDAVVERFNRTLKQMLAIFCSENQNNWDDYLPYLLMAYRASEHSSTKCTPNLLMYGQEINLPVDLMYGIPPESQEIECTIQYVEWLKSALRLSFQVVNENLKVAAKRQKKYYNRKATETEYQVGSFVWRFYPPFADKKLALGWIGPYLIIKKVSEVTYSLQKSPTSPVVNVHVDYIKSYLGENSPTPWIDSDGNPVFTKEVEDKQNDSSLTQNQYDSSYFYDDPDFVGQDDRDMSQDRDSNIETPEIEEELEREHEPDPIILTKTPVRTRAGRVVKPRDIYSP